MHPRRADTDGDGIRDGAENAGVISAVTGPLVTIQLAAGGVLSALEAPACADGLEPGTVVRQAEVDVLPLGAVFTTLEVITR